MHVFEVQILNEDGDLADAYIMRCDDILEASRLPERYGGDAAVLVREVTDNCARQT